MWDIFPPSWFQLSVSVSRSKRMKILQVDTAWLTVSVLRKVVFQPENFTSKPKWPLKTFLTGQFF